MHRVIICIRVRNEERWLKLLLKSLNKQTFRDFEIVIVNNDSSDFTEQIATSKNIKIINITNYNPAKAINIGIQSAVSYNTAEIAVILSAHCIPVGDNWLEKMINSFNQNIEIVGVYGRQIPMKSSNFDNMRDLLYTFGSESFTHNNKVFFHNANSAVRMDYFKYNFFNEEVAHIEDFDWALKVSQNNKKIYYNSDAVVWHYHGLHKHQNKSFRSESVSKTLKSITRFEHPNEKFLYLDKLETIVVLERKKNSTYSTERYKACLNTAKKLGAELIEIVEDSSDTLFSRINNAISDKQKLKCNIVFFWSEKYGEFDKELAVKLHKILILNGADAVVQVKRLKSGICIQSEDNFIQFSNIDSIIGKSVYITSFGRGSIFWGDAIWSKNPNKIKFSKLEYY